MGTDRGVNREELRAEEQEIAQRREQDSEEIRDEQQEADEAEQDSAGVVVASMRRIFDQHPDFEPPEWLAPEQKDALALLYEAKVGEREEIGDGHVSGLERMQALNMALATLRPLLSTVSGPDHADIGEEVAQLQDDVAELRAELKQTIYKEAVPRQKAKDKGEGEDAGDEDDPEEPDDDGDDDSGDDDADGDGEKPGLLRRLFGGDGKKKE